MSDAPAPTASLPPDATARRVFSFHRPATLADWLQQRATLKGRLRQAQPLDTTGMWPASWMPSRRVSTVA